MARSLLGFFFLLAFVAMAAGGIWLLYRSEGGGVPFTVTFGDGKGLEEGSKVIYRDQPVGRVVKVTTRAGRAEVEARLGSDHASLLHEGSRFWVQAQLGGTLLCFDTPIKAGDVAKTGAAFIGLETRPEPDEPVVQAPKKLQARPEWLCEVRVSATLHESGDLVRDERRKSAAVVVRKDGGRVQVLAPGWVLEGFQGALVGRTAFVEFAGGETCVALPLRNDEVLALFEVSQTNYAGGVAPFWKGELPEGQPVALVNFKSELWSGEYKAGAIVTGGELPGGCIALVDGTNVCGFALPAVGSSTGGRWVSLAGAAKLLSDK